MIPYKPLAQCSMEELAAYQRWKDGRHQVGGVAFARKEEQGGKNAARRAVLKLLTREQKPNPKLSILTMPGVDWKFETALLWQRNSYWKKTKTAKAMRFTCIENDRLIYYSALTRIPRNERCVIRSIDRPSYAECATSQGIIDRYIFANVDDLMQDPGESFDVAWLDYTGPLSVDRMKIIERFWQERVRDTLVVTALKARWTKETSLVIDRHGSCLAWLRAKLPGRVLHEIEYQDGASPMVQFAIAKN